MSEHQVRLKEDTNGSRRIVIGILVAVLIIGGSVAAYIAFKSTPKNNYFLAERSSMEFMNDAFQDRYEPELNWREQVQSNPTRSTYELSGTYDSADQFDMFGPEQFINYSTLTITNERDMQDQELATKINANLANFELGDISFYATDDQIMVGLPFLQDLLAINSDDVGQLLHNLDPSLDPDMEIDFSVLFDNLENNSTEKQKDHIKQEYIELIYEELPEEAFETSKEKINIHDESVNAKKIEFHLSEEEIKDLLIQIIDKLSKDEVMKEMIYDTIVQAFDFGLSLTSINPQLGAEIDMIMDGYEEALQEIKNEVESFVFEDGMTSTIWTDKDLIVKREFNIEMGPNQENLVALSIDGTQLLQDKDQEFDYEIDVSDSYGQESMDITASFTEDEGDSNDSITLAFANEQVSYDSAETFNDNEREFERSITFDDNYEPIQFNWNGNATYESEEMDSTNQFSVDFADISEDTASLQIEKNAELIKQVDMDEDASIKDIGSMSENELHQYFEFEVPMQFEQWLFDNLGGDMFGF